MISQEKYASAGVAMSEHALRVSAHARLHVYVLVLLRVLKGEVYLKHYPSNSALHSGGALQALCNPQRDVTSWPLTVNNPPSGVYVFPGGGRERERKQACGGSLQIFYLVLRWLKNMVFKEEGTFL